jgi:hypothetical protein
MILALPSQPPLSPVTPDTTERIAAYRHVLNCSLVTIWRDRYVAEYVSAIWQSPDGAVTCCNVFRNVELLQQTLIDVGYEVVDA